MLKKLWLVFLLLCGEPLWAVKKNPRGGMVGNGGDAYVCRDEKRKIVSAVLYDYFEAKVLHIGLIIDLGDPDKGFVEQATFAIDRLKKLDPVRAERYLARFPAFLADSDRPVDTELLDIPDHGGMIKPKPGCEIEQLAIRQEKKSVFHRQFVINKEIWLELSERDKAGLMLHEIIYENAIFHGFRDSVMVRLFNAFISSNGIGFYSVEEYQKLVLSIGMGDTQLLLAEEAQILRYFSEKGNFFEAREKCLNLGGTLYGDFAAQISKDLARSAFIGYLATQPWWGKLVVEGQDNFTTWAFSVRDKRIQKDTESRASQLPFVCAFDTDLGQQLNAKNYYGRFKF